LPKFVLASIPCAFILVMVIRRLCISFGTPDNQP
jgi:hypothetical protein